MANLRQLNVEIVKMKRRQNEIETTLHKCIKLWSKAMSVFDPETFLATSTEEAGETRYTPVPEGEYQAVVEDVNAREAKDQVLLDVRYEILNDELRNDMNMERITVTQGLFLDLTAEGLLDWGTNKNVKLGKLRAAVGQNVDGEPWSPSMLKGAGPLMIYVTQSPDKEDSSIVYNRVKSTAPVTA